MADSICETCKHCTKSYGREHKQFKVTMKGSTSPMLFFKTVGDKCGLTELLFVEIEECEMYEEKKTSNG